MIYKTGPRRFKIWVDVRGERHQIEVTLSDTRGRTGQVLQRYVEAMLLGAGVKFGHEPID